MKTLLKKHIPHLLVLFLILAATACGGDSADVEADFDISPDFTPSADTSLADMVVNTFVDNGVSITTDPEYIDFNDLNGEISQDDEIKEAFTISNNSGETRYFKFTIYSVSTGFSILDENEQNIGGYSEIEVGHGETKTFYVQFNAWVFGTQTSYVSITADIDGYIRLPLRASVTGPSDFKIIPTGYFCSDDDAPEVDYLDFYKVAYGQTRTEGIKICNTGGEDIKITSVSIDNNDDVLLSAAMDNNSFEDFIWQVSDEIDSSFSFGLEPNNTSTFSEPTFIDYTGPVDNPAGGYSVSVYHTGQEVQNILLEAGKILRLDMEFSPTLDIEADDGYLYNSLAMNAVVNLHTSLGIIRLPLVAATSGVEPILEMAYRFSDEEAWRSVDLTSDGAAIYYGSVDIFLDWVSTNSSTAQIKIINAGTGSKTLEFYGGSINGFFEYTWEETELSFPLELVAGAEATFSIQYLPSTSAELNGDFEASFDFGQFYFQHTGGNGPQGKVSLVGEQDSGYAVELLYGGTKLEREYAEGRNQNLCVFSTDSSTPTSATFKVYNNNKEDTMNVNWSVTSDASLTVTPSSDSFSIEPDSSQSFTVEFYGSVASIGQMLAGELVVETTFPEKESAYASLLTGMTPRTFTVPFQAMSSESGESNLCNTGVLGDDGTQRVTFVMDRITMVMTDLIESAHNPPPFRFHLALELNREQGTARLAEPIELQFDKDNLNYLTSIRSYLHQATNIKGCSPLPTDPYRLEFQKGSHTGTGIECADDGVGTIEYTTPEGEERLLDSDTACMPTNGGEEYIDDDGTRWMVVYHEFTKFDSCNVEYYGRIATFAYRPDVETVSDVFERAEEDPNESESFYEGVYGAFQFGSYITFLDDTKCAGNNYGPSTIQTINDPDEVKDCYKSIASKSDTKRQDGFVDECSYFVFLLEDEGVVPDDVDSENPDYDSWEGFGTYEPHVDDDGETHETKYDITIYNAHFKAIVLGAGDRSIFFSHPGHLIYTDMNVTITTKRVAEDEWYNGDWQQRIAVTTRPHLDKNQIYLKDGERYDTAKFWREDGWNEEFSNLIDYSSLAHSGINYGGYGKGNYRYMYQDFNSKSIVFAGWPVNFDENNLLLFVGIGVFNGKGNTAPSFAKADAATGQGKPLYFSFHGCLIPGIASSTQGCFDFHRDDGVMPNGTPIIDVYTDLGMLPNGYVDAADCSNLEDPGFADLDNPDYDVYKYMTCVDFMINDFDRDRYKNYYDNANKFDYGNDPYGSSTCGYGN